MAGYKSIILLASTAININNSVSITFSGVVWPDTLNDMLQSKYFDKVEPNVQGSKFIKPGRKFVWQRSIENYTSSGT